MDIFMRGLIIGFSIAAPVGPIGVLCIRRTLAEGRISGLISGLGAASADAIYGIIAGFGITIISHFLVTQQIWLRLVGGIFLFYLGVRTYRSKSGNHKVNFNKRSLAGNYLSVFMLTLTNPLTILSFTAIFAGLGLAQNGRDYQTTTWLVLGVFSGSALWWLTLSQGVGILRRQVTSQWFIWINRGSGIVLMLFGILTLASVYSQISPL